NAGSAIGAREDQHDAMTQRYVHLQNPSCNWRAIVQRTYTLRRADCASPTGCSTKSGERGNSPAQLSALSRLKESPRHVFRVAVVPACEIRVPAAGGRMRGTRPHGQPGVVGLISEKSVAVECGRSSWPLMPCPRGIAAPTVIWDSKPAGTTTSANR